MSTKHKNFSCKLSGLWINPLYPHMGASPDGLIKCDCCGNGLLEIQCPFSLKDVHPSDISSSMCSFITDAGCLNQKHKYYTQVQGQLMITNRIFCDFVIWTTKGLRVVQRIYHDVRMWEKLEKKITAFYVAYVLPETMTRKLKEMNSESDKENIYCLCQGRSSGRMIACDNLSCEFQWFHYNCVGIKRTPPGNWYCPTCKPKKLKL